MGVDPISLTALATMGSSLMGSLGSGAAAAGSGLMSGLGALGSGLMGGLGELGSLGSSALSGLGSLGSSALGGLGNLAGDIFGGASPLVSGLWNMINPAGLLGGGGAAASPASAATSVPSLLPGKLAEVDLGVGNIGNGGTLLPGTSSGDLGLPGLPKAAPGPPSYMEKLRDAAIKQALSQGINGLMGGGPKRNIQVPPVDMPPPVMAQPMFVPTFTGQPYDSSQLYGSVPRPPRGMF